MSSSSNSKRRLGVNQRSRRLGGRQSERDIGATDSNLRSSMYSAARNSIATSDVGSSDTSCCGGTSSRDVLRSRAAAKSRAQVLRQGSNRNGAVSSGFGTAGFFFVLALFALVLLTLLSLNANAANDPGHDSLYVLKIGDSNVVGSINLTANLNASFVKFTNRVFGDYLDINANGTILAAPSQPRIMAGTNVLYIDSTGNLYLNTKGGTTGLVQVGDTATNAVTFNVSGQLVSYNITGRNIYSTGGINSSGAMFAGGSQVCTVANGLCAGAGASSSAGGWTNDSTTTRTTLQTIVNSSNIGGSFIVQNSTGSTHLFVNGSNGYIGIGTAAPTQLLDVAGNLGVNGNITMPSNFFIGSGAISGGISSIALGSGAQASGDYSIAAGISAIASASSAVALGGTATNGGAIAIGGAASGAYAVAVGYGSVASGNPSVAVGYLANASYLNSVAIGPHATAVAINQLVIGNITPGNNLNTKIFGTLNATGTIYQNNVAVCLSDGTNCPASASVNSAGGWSNSSTTTRTPYQAIVNSSNISGSFIVQNQSGRVDLFVNGSSGYVGVGNASPQYPLSVYTVVGYPVAQFYSGWAGVNQGLSISIDSSGVVLDSSSSLIFDTTGTPRMALSSNGNFAVGSITTPSSTLQVNSSGAAGSFWVLNTTGSTHLFVNGSNGYIGIGTGTPSSKLTLNVSTATTDNVIDIISSRNSVLLMTSQDSGGQAWNIASSGSNAAGGAGNFIISVAGQYPAVLIDGSKNVGIATIQMTQKLTVNGSANISQNIYYGGNISGYGADLAEYIAGEGVEAGDVVAIDTQNDKSVVKSTTAYDTTVAGIVSTRPSSIMGVGEGTVLLALAGRVPVKVTNETGPIRRGDLLTTSSTAGHAMRCPGRGVCSGAVVGKALEEFNGAEGMITALVVLG